MKICKLIAVAGLSGYYNKDFKAIRAGVDTDGFVYAGQPVTEGFTAIAQPGQAISILLELEDGQVAWGDCVDVIFAGSAGRDRVFRSTEHLSTVENEIHDYYINKEIGSFRDMDAELDELEVDGKRLHTAVRYGVSQALLDAVAKSRHLTITEVLVEEYGTELPIKPTPMAAMTPTNQKFNVDKMILKEVDYLPHASFSNTERDFGRDGGQLLEYVGWVRDRIQRLGRPGYQPNVHLDIYGTLGEAFENHIPSIVDYLRKLSQAVKPYKLVLETPIIAATQEEQLRLFKELREGLKEAQLDIPLIVDEWCNTLEDIMLFADSQACDIAQVKVPDLGVVSKSVEASLFCKKQGIGVYIGGSANETDQSARISAHISMATHADILIAKPGQGTDEALLIELNEMLRTLKLIAMRS